MTTVNATGETVDSTGEAGRCPLARRATEPAPYVAYAAMDRLHELAKPVTDSPRELTFILVSQVKELLFRVVHTEVDQARRELREDEPEAACVSLDRAARTQRVLLACWETMTAMSPGEFLEFRDILGEASGTQSFMYRALEFSLGNKHPGTVREAGPYLHRYPVLDAELHAPSLYDEALWYLHRTGLVLPSAVLDRDVGTPYTAVPEVEDAWLTVYRDPITHRLAHRVAEALTELSYQFSLWRSQHLLVVERMLGNKPGTGGTSGLDWLRAVNEHRFFPELWSARTRM